MINSVRQESKEGFLRQLSEEQVQAKKRYEGELKTELDRQSAQLSAAHEKSLQLKDQQHSEKLEAEAANYRQKIDQLQQ